jgi:hypothetical protein
MVIRRVTPLSVAKVAGALYMVLGLIFGALFSLIAFTGSAIGFDSHGPGETAMGALFGVGAIVLFPIVYGAMGFAGTFIMALIYNAIAGVVGGIEVDVQ